MDEISNMVKKFEEISSSVEKEVQTAKKEMEEILKENGLESNIQKSEK